MAYYYKDGSGIDSSAYIYVQLQVTRTDYPTYSHFSVKSVAVSDTGTSSFIRGQVTTNQGGTSWTAATGWKNVYYNGTTTLATATFDVTRGASDKTAHIGAYAEGGGTGIYSGGTDYAWLDVTVPKVLAPNAPTGCTVTYVSDSQASVSWTNGTTDSDHPRDATLVERRDGSNDWAQVASVGGSATSYTDSGISANTQYQYRVRAKNVAGYSDYSASGSIYTTPAAPASVTLDKTAATTVQVDVTGTWGYAVTYDIESTYDGGATWGSVVTSTSLPYSATVNAGTVKFRVRATRGALASAWTLSASLVTICPPLAPTIVQAPANPTAYGDGSTVAWTPNHPDGSTQSAAEVKVTNPGGTSTTYSVSTATSYSFTPNATGTWTAQVRTKGLDPSYGEWSQTVSWGVHNPPSVVITSPATDGTDIVALPLNVAWTVTDSTGVSVQRIIIEGSDGEVLNRTLAGDVRTVALNASDVALENGQTYTIRLRVMGGSGLVTEQTRIFDVAWLAPAAPVLQLTEGEGRSATIDVMDTRYTSSGTVLEASSAMMESLTIDGLSVQDGTPTPSAPVAIKSVQGANLYDPSTAVSGYLTTTGTIAAATANAEMTSDFIPVTEGEVMTLLMHVDNPSVNQPWLAFEWFKSDKTFGGILIRQNIAGYSNYIIGTYWNRYIMPENAAYVRVSARHLGTGNGSVAVKHGYAPMTITDHGSITVKGVGVNKAVELFDCYIGSGSTAPYTATLPSATTQERTIGIPIFGDGSVGFSVDGCTTDMTSTSTGGWMRGVFLDSSGNKLSNVDYGGRDMYTYTATTIRKNVPIPIPSGTALMLLSFRTYGGTPCVRLDGSNEYVAPTSTTTPIPVTGRSLPDGTHDEWISGETADTLIQRVGMQVFDGSNYIPWFSGNGPYPRFGITFNGLAACTVMCEQLTERATMALVVSNAYSICGTTDNRLYFSLSENETTAADATAALAAHPITVYYKLATPVTTTLTHVDLPYVDGSAWVDAEVTPSIEATFRPVDFPDQPTIQSVDVQRVNADGTAWTVATGLTVGGSCIDPLPPLGVPVAYRATSSAASGSTASGEFTETFGGRDWALNFGNGAQESIMFRYNPQASYSMEHGGESYHFADGGAGGGRPVFYPTTDRDESGSLKFDTIGKDDADRLRALCDRYPVAWLRDPFGHRWRAHVKPSWSHGVGQLWPIGIGWDAVRWTEAWDG